MPHIQEYLKDQIWILEYPVRFLGMELFARTTIIRLDNGDLIVHDPCRIDDAVKGEIDALGVVKFIIAPGSYHHLFVSDFQEKYPDAETYLCPGLERKRPDLKFDGILGDKPDARWAGTLDQVLIQGTRYILGSGIFSQAFEDTDSRGPAGKYRRRLPAQGGLVTAILVEICIPDVEQAKGRSGISGGLGKQGFSKGWVNPNTQLGRRKGNPRAW